MRGIEGVRGRQTHRGRDRQKERARDREKKISNFIAIVDVPDVPGLAKAQKSMKIKSLK
jgi:hypothetical protein